MADIEEVDSAAAVAEWAGKPKGKHPENRLTAPAIKAAKPGRHADGNGLYLEVDENGAEPLR